MNNEEKQEKEKQETLHSQDSQDSQHSQHSQHSQDSQHSQHSQDSQHSQENSQQSKDGSDTAAKGSGAAEEPVLKAATEQIGRMQLKVEGLKDGYRFTFRTDEEKMKSQRRVGGSFIGLLIQMERAGWRLPWLLRKLLAFWRSYETPGRNGKHDKK